MRPDGIYNVSNRFRMFYYGDAPGDGPTDIRFSHRPDTGSHA